MRGDLVCTQCARVAGTAEGSEMRAAPSVTIRAHNPDSEETVRRLCCPHCSARLWLQNSQRVPDDPLEFIAQAARTRYGRPAKAALPREEAAEPD